MEVGQFGKDHWSAFAYAECCCVDDQGRLDIRRLRVNEAKRPIRSNGLGWEPKYGTIVKGGSVPDPAHDDIDCLDDLEKAGLIEQIGTLINPVVKLTKKGARVVAKLRQHKATGGQFATFEYA